MSGRTAAQTLASGFILFAIAQMTVERTGQRWTFYFLVAIHFLVLIPTSLRLDLPLGTPFGRRWLDVGVVLGSPIIGPIVWLFTWRRRVIAETKAAR